jgi:secreted Zn-dependent insulinase-like peptidase
MKQNWIFKIPKIYCGVTLSIDAIFENPKNYVIFQLYLDIVQYQLGSALYYAQLCSSGYEMNIGLNQIQIMFYGYNDAIERIIKIVVDKLFNITPKENEFHDAKYDMKNYLKNFIYNPAFALATDYIKEKFYTINFTNNELLNAIQNVTYDDIIKPKTWIGTNCNMKTFIYGNINANVDHILRHFNKFKCNGTNNNGSNSIIYLDKGEQNIYLKKSLNDNDDNNAILAFFEIGKIIKDETNNWIKQILLLMLVEYHVKEKFFSQLRSVEQSGYIVKAYINKFQDNIGALYGLTFLIQSPHLSPVTLRKRIRKFTKDMNKLLINITDEQFNAYKLVTKSSLVTDFTSSYDEFSYYWSQIVSSEYIFNGKEILANNIDDITKEEFYNEYFINKNTRKIRILEIYKN